VKNESVKQEMEKTKMGRAWEAIRIRFIDSLKKDSERPLETKKGSSSTSASNNNESNGCSN